MAAEESAVSVPECLQALGVSLVTEWDTLAFLYSHSPSLGTAAELARLIGYEKAEVGEALQRLEQLGLIQRSRASEGIRIYKFSEPAEPGCRSCLLEMMSLAQNRAGRLLLLKHLARPSRERRRSGDRGGLHLA